MQSLVRQCRRRFSALNFEFVTAACHSSLAAPEPESQDEDRENSHKFASTSQSSPDPVLARWRVMQEAIQRPSPRRSPVNGSRDFEDADARFLKKSKSKSSTLPAAGNGEDTVLDWREAVRQAKQLLTSENLQETALTDLFGRKHTYLRISLTEKCNLRCLYCMPEDGVPLMPSSHMLTSEEIVHLVGLFANAGVTKIRLTGGEPTLRRDLVSLTQKLGQTPGIQQIGITSNGIVLRRSLQDLQANGLTLVNLSLDTLKEERFEQMTRRPGLSRVLASIDHAIELGFNPVKVNVVLMRGVNDDEVCDFVELTRHRPINVRFIEYMPFDGNIWDRRKMISYKEMMTALENTYGKQLEPLQDPKGEVAKNFRIPDFVGSVSFITSMTSAFCGDCNRLRLMADGNLKVCLFGANEVSLRDAMRGGASDEDILSIISLAVNKKKAAHAGMNELAKMKNRAMVQIGG